MNTYDALASAIYVARQNLVGASINTDGLTYRCVSDTNYSPEDYAQAWEIV